MACSECNKTYQAYLCDIPSAWREQIAELMCKVVGDVEEITCEEVQECETLTTLSPFTLDGDTLSITYVDERGVSITRTIELTGLGDVGNFIEDQFVSAQSAEFWIDGRSSVGNVSVTSATLPSNGLYLPGTNTLGMTAGGALITKLQLTNGLMTHSGNIFLDAVISAAPGISFFLNNFTDNDYFVQRTGTAITLHGAGLANVSGGSDTIFSVNQNANRGFEWETGGNNLMQLFTDGTLLLMNTNVQQTPDTGAILKLVSTTRALVFPNMTTAQKMAISPPSPGAVVFDTDLQKLCVYTTIWETITSS